MAELYIGLMSGTSMDGIDAALVDFTSDPHILATQYTPYDKETRQQLFTLCSNGNNATHNEIELLAATDIKLGQLFANAALEVLQQAGVAPKELKAIGSHGQTIRHEPHAPMPYSLQIANPNVIAELTGITTVADFRNRDIAAGGEGAPLVPAFHNKIFRSSDCDRVVVNIGGIANITVLPKDMDVPVIGFDTGPGNVFMDSWVERHLGTTFDAEGQWSAGGKIDRVLLNSLLTHTYLNLKPPKSTGREQFNVQWLDEILRGMDPPLSPQDTQTTLCEFTADTISKAIHTYAAQAQEVLICGGGAHNKTLINRLAALLQDCTIHSTEKFGIHPDWVESVAFAWLAKQTLSGQPGNLPSVTGARRPVILGGIYKAQKS